MHESPAVLMRRVTDEIWNGRRVDLVDELVAEDFVDHVDLPVEAVGGRERYRATVEGTLAAFSDYHEAIEFVVADDDTAVTYITVSGTHDGDLFGLPPSGNRLEYRGIGILRFRDGKVVERWGVADSMTMMGQLGLLG